MLQDAYFLAKIGADTAENEQHFAEILPIGHRVADPFVGAGCPRWTCGPALGGLSERDHREVRDRLRHLSGLRFWSDTEVHNSCRTSNYDAT